MPVYILNIETTTKNCSAAVSKDGELLTLKELYDEKYTHAENLNVFIEHVMQEAGLQFTDLHAIAVSKGPGSYTGLRIGVSAAKGFCYALDIPLIAVDTLTALAHTVKKPAGIIIPVLDARRMEVYQAVFDQNYEQLQATKAVEVHGELYKEYLENGQVTFIGDAVQKIEQIIQNPNAMFVRAFPSAREMPSLSYPKYLAKDFVDVAYFEPYYLKDFIAVKKR